MPRVSSHADRLLQLGSVLWLSTPSESTFSICSALFVGMLVSGALLECSVLLCFLGHTESKDSEVLFCAGERYKGDPSAFTHPRRFPVSSSPTEQDWCALVRGRNR